MNGLFDTRFFLDSKLILTELGYLDIYLLSLAGISMGLFIAKQIWYRTVDPVAVVDPVEPTVEKLVEEPVEPAVVEEEIFVVPPSAKEDPVVAPLPVPVSRAGRSENMFKRVVEEPIVEEEKSRRIVYIMDVSKSLSAGQFALCKSELTQALKELPESTEYQVIFFSGATWFAHQRMIEGGKKGENVVIRDGDKIVTWNSGFGEFRFEKGNHNLPEGEWRKATKENIDASLKDVEEVKRSFGTTWHLPFMLAMNLETVPTEIYFLTDGETAHQNLVAEGIVDMVKSIGPETQIHTRALMVPKAAEPLRHIAKETAGEYLLIDLNVA